MTANILVFSGSIRSGSVNSQAAAAAAKALALKGASVTRISLEDFSMPIFDEDLEAEKGIPENALKLGRIMAQNNGMVIASPEYNGSVTPLLKNALDWVSRVKEDKQGSFTPYGGKYVALMGASPGGLGGIRGLEHLRVILRNVGAEVITAQVAIGGAHKAFNDDGTLKDERQAHMLNTMCDKLMAQLRAQSMLDQ